ncbi:ABC transporter permease subunit [Jidongwangia harbinensis]|uniref:ABC transporter permease subunit n=1 Tax=Jidongwangia harbinensis TaxID=2878561 RepID=UPI001CDA3081|nr:ABC transporter permease subunit [Jidongwangia harbinensis]MCA2213625.1 ABC transporter permease [Jidongwangia harbinensis]
MSLYKAETRRLVKRRFTRWLVIGSLFALAAVAVGTAVTNSKVGPEQIAAAQAEAERYYQESVRYAEQDRLRCEAAKGTPEAGQYPADCGQMYTPSREDYGYQGYMTPTFDFREEFGNMVVTLAAILALAAFVIGASYVGAEWSTGGMMNLLLWRPKRLQVLTTKLLALLVSLAVLTVLTAVAWTGAFALIANLRGSLDSMTSGAWQSFALMELRALGLVLAAGAIGFGIASLGRHTALALGAVVGLLVVFQFGLVTVLSMAEVKFAEAWLLPIWVMAWMSKTVTIEDFNSCNYSADGCRPDQLTLTWPMAGGAMVVAVVLVVGTALWTMRSRDIT